MEDKILCGCHNVSLKDVKDAIKKGINSFEELQDITNIGTSCEPCKTSNKAIFEELLVKK
jgi:bacterioferritin-associated ferredoxin